MYNNNNNMKKGRRRKKRDPPHPSLLGREPIRQSGIRPSTQTLQSAGNRLSSSVIPVDDLQRLVLLPFLLCGFWFVGYFFFLLLLSREGPSDRADFPLGSLYDRWCLSASIVCIKSSESRVGGWGRETKREKRNGSQQSPCRAIN